MILGTAGHIDHGKTALVKALTGVDTDRLPEEKRRGITIELGFAPLQLDEPAFSGTLGVVDVPGHEAFIRTMLAGATGVDLAMLVVAADEGIMPQTREHLDIVTLLGVRGGVVALTKSDLVEPEWILLVEDEIRTALAGSALEGAAIVACSATTRAGLPALRGALAAAAASIPARDAADLLRLPVDRAFSVRGMGTVVTGTLWSGTVTRETTVRYFRHTCEGTARVRSLESHGAAMERALPGNRVALALAAVDRDDVSRGALIVGADDPWRPSTVMRADVALLPGARAAGVRTRVRLHLGTAEVGARLVGASGPVAAGAVTPVRIALDEPVVARAGDRFVLRGSSPATTIGGGIVTDPFPPSRRPKVWPLPRAAPAQRLAWIVGESGGDGVPVADLPVRLGVTPREVGVLISGQRGQLRIHERLYAADVADRVREKLLSAVSAFHAAHPLEPGLSLEEIRSSLGVRVELFENVLARAIDAKRLSVRDGVVVRAGWKVADPARLDALAGALEAGGFEPPSVAELSLEFGSDAPALLRALERDGRAVAVAKDRYYGRAALTLLVQRLRTAGAGPAWTASQIKDSLGLTRKYLIPLLEYCDRSGITDRRGDLRTIRPG